KGQYIYYHCAGAKGKCPEPYTRQEVLEERFADILKGLVFDNEVMRWVTRALREIHGDERHFHEKAIARLQTEYQRLQDRLDAIYVDSLEGRIDTPFFAAKAAEWRDEQARLSRTIEEHRSANKTYSDEGARLLDLARQAHRLFRKQVASEKRRLLNFVLSNCIWKRSELHVTYRQPFEMLAETARSHEALNAAGASAERLFENWLPGPGSNQRLPD